MAKNPHIHRLMMEKLQAGTLNKTYFALVYGVAPSKGVIDAPIARREKPSLLRYVDEGGKPCKTEFIRLENWEKYSLLELHPITGRTHQLRVHCAYIGHPILGDPQYGDAASQELSKAMEMETQALCAGSLAFDHPITGKKVIINTKTPVYKE